jgi:hypothetical protein
LVDNQAMNMIKQFRDLGLFRTVMLGTTVVLAGLGPFNDGTTYVSGWRLLTSVVAPAMMVIMVFLLLLDITMTRVFATDALPDRQKMLLKASVVETWLLLGLCLAWAPFMLRMLGVNLFE